MHFDHYGGQAARLAADLVNTPAEHFTPGRLAPVLSAHGVVERTLSDLQAESLLAWSRELEECFGGQDVEQRCQRVNALLRRSASTPRIALHDGDPHLHYGSAEADAAAHVRAMTAAGLAHIVCSAGPNRLGRCLRAACSVAFVDTSRNGRRAYCSARCANNAAVSRHRERGNGRGRTGGNRP